MVSGSPWLIEETNEHGHVSLSVPSSSMLVETNLVQWASLASLAAAALCLAMSSAILWDLLSGGGSLGCVAAGDGELAACCCWLGAVCLCGVWGMVLCQGDLMPGSMVLSTRMVSLLLLVRSAKSCHIDWLA